MTSPSPFTVLTVSERTGFSVTSADHRTRADGHGPWLILYTERREDGPRTVTVSIDGKNAGESTYWEAARYQANIRQRTKDDTGIMQTDGFSLQGVRFPSVWRIRVDWDRPITFGVSAML